jgi:hypothetical protein
MGDYEELTRTDSWTQDITGFVLVYSVGSRSSFSHIKDITGDIGRRINSQAFLSMVLVGNK